MSRPLIGKFRTRGRVAVAALAQHDPSIVARLLSMRVHTVRAVLSGRCLAGPRFLAAVTRVSLPA
jgi:hypothetical protein